MSDEQAMWRAQLADMPLEAICAYLRERGRFVMRSILGHPILWECLPVGWPPLADLDELPFDTERDV